MDKNKFLGSGRFMQADKFMKERPSELLHVDCTDVVVYKDGRYIQSLKDGMFLYEEMKDIKLDVVEDYMWKKMDEC